MGIILSSRYKKGNSLVTEVSVNNYTDKTLNSMASVMSEWNKMHPSGTNAKVTKEGRLATLSIEFDNDDEFHARLFPIFATNVLENESTPSSNITYDDNDDAYAY